MLEHTIESCQCEGKRCSRCKEVKCYGTFPVDKRKRSGITSPCLVCRRAGQKEYRRVHGEQVRAGQREYRRTHAEQVRAYHRAYHEAHAEHLNEQERARYHKHAEQINASRRRLRYENIEQSRAYHREYNRRHAERINAQKRKHYQTYLDKKANKQKYYREHIERIRVLRKEHQVTHAEQIKKYKKAQYQEYAEQFKAQKRDFYQEKAEFVREKRRNHRKAHPELYVDSDKVHVAKRRAQKVQAGGLFTVWEWRDLKDQYNYTCLCCGKQEPEVKLTADHVIPLSKGGSSFISNIQPLCASCNSKKHNKIVDYRTKQGDRI